jgi:hypothetical protein
MRSPMAAGPGAFKGTDPDDAQGHSIAQFASLAEPWEM